MAEIIDLDPFVDGSPKPKVITEGWVAKQFANEHAGKLLYGDDESRWYQWTGPRWEMQRKGLAREKAHELATEMSATASNRKEMQTWRFASAVTNLAADNHLFSRQTSDWNRDPFLIGTLEDTIDLATAQARPPAPADMISKAVAIMPEDFEDCPRWLEFLRESTGADDDLILFLQRWLGYCLTGDTREHTLLFIYGDGGNGKSVFQNTIAGIMGDYAVTASMETFTSNRYAQHPADLAMLAGARLVTASETEEGRAWDEARVKQLTGGDPITARRMRQDFFTFTPNFKLMIVGNHQPILRNVDDAIKRRLCMVPFTRKPAKPNTHLAEDLKSEWPGILRWMINGCADWLEHGLPRPPVVLTANEEYAEDQDILGQFLAEDVDVELGNTWKNEKSSDLFAAFSAFCRRANVEPGTIKGFSSRLEHRGFTKARTAAGRYFQGVQLKRTSQYD